MKKAFTIIALDELPLLLGEKQFDISALVGELPDYKPELRELKRRWFFIREDPELSSGWCIPAIVMLWWLADEWIKTLRQQDDLSLWLTSQGLDGGRSKVGERKQIGATVKKAASFFKDGAEIFIKAAAEGLGKGITQNA